MYTPNLTLTIGSFGKKKSRNACIALPLLWVLLSAPSLANAAKTGPDSISIAAVLIQDGNYERAFALLEDASSEAIQSDEGRYHTLRGIASLHSGKYEQAQLAFERAIEIRNTNREEMKQPRSTKPSETLQLYSYLALVHWALGDCEKALTASEKSGPKEQHSAKMFILRADCQAKTQDADAAFLTLRAGQKRFPSNRALIEKELHFLCELGLYAEMRARSTSWLNKISVEEGLRLLAMLHAQDAQVEIIFFAERLRLQFPNEKQIALFLAQAYRKRDHPLAAAQVMEGLAMRDEGFALDAAELYRRAGWRKVASIVGARSRDSNGKLRQRFGMLLEEGRFDEAASLAARLHRSGLLEDDSIRYALAYAQFESGSLQEARQMLRDVKDEKIFRQAAELRQMMDACEAKGWACR